MAGPYDFGPPAVDFTPLSQLGATLGEGVRQRRMDARAAQQQGQGAPMRGWQGRPVGEPMNLTGGGPTGQRPAQQQGWRPGPRDQRLLMQAHQAASRGMPMPQVLEWLRSNGLSQDVG
jgi:hypothetical protein